MTCTATKNLIKFAITELRKDGKIDTTTETSLESFVDDITLTDFLEVTYSDFDQVNSTNISFADAGRTATTAASSTLLTDALGLSDVKIKALKLKSDLEDDITWSISKDGTNYFTVSSYNLNENITSSEDLYVKVATDETIVITGMIIIYERNS